MKKIVKSIISLLLCTMLLCSCAACGKDDDADGFTRVDFWGWGDQDEVAIYENLVNTFNETVGKEEKIKVVFTQKPYDGYTSLMERTASGSKCPDVFYVEDNYFKKWVELGFIECLDDYMKNTTIDLEDIWTNAIERYRYDPDKNVSTSTSSYYGLPKSVDPTVIYYNETAMINAGVTVISCDEEDLYAFNYEGARDKRGKTKAEYGIECVIPAVGYYRSENPYVGGNWISLQKGEVAVFNNRIAMSWDQTEDLATLLTKEYNKNSATDYGYFTEWWFNYVFSVGGDCIEDKTGEGDYTFTLADETPNYITAEAITVNGNRYEKNQTLSYLDKMNDKLDGIDSAVKQLEAEGKLIELPSNREAFTRFVSIAQTTSNGGLGICPSPNTISTAGKAGYFTSGKVAMLVDASFRIDNIDRTVGNNFVWDVAPLPVYSEITYDETNEDGTVIPEVIRSGVPGGHSTSSAFVMWSGSQKKDETFLFMEWMLKDGGIEQCKTGYNFPNNKSGKQYYIDANDKPKNIEVFFEMAQYQTPGDWWYLSDKLWIDDWAAALNGKVRNGSMTLSTFFNTYIEPTNEILKGYK